MTYLQAIILGIVQGLTEFLPVSSSGHLVIVQSLMEVNDLGVTFELMVHVGTLFSVLIYFRQRLFEMLKSLWTPSLSRERKLIFFLFLATLPTVAVALLFKDSIEAAFDSPVFACSMLLVTAFLLLLPVWIKDRENDVRAGSSLAMGLGQALAILPGISRSGSTIVAGRLAGMQPARAAEFSFLMAIPAILGAAVFQTRDFLEMKENGQMDQIPFGPYLVGTFFAFLFGLVAVYAVLAMIRRGKFQYFAYYCIAVGIGGILYFSLTGT